jgi:hypothetical protein
MKIKIWLRKYYLSKYDDIWSIGPSIIIEEDIFIGTVNILTWNLDVSL